MPGNYPISTPTTTTNHLTHISKMASPIDFGNTPQIAPVVSSTNPDNTHIAADEDVSAAYRTAQV
jgi:hypothetical protein